MNPTERQLADMVAAYRQVRRPPKHLRLQVARNVSRAQHQVVRRWLAGMGVGAAAAAAAIFVVHLVAVQSLSSRRDPAASPNEAVYEHRESDGDSSTVTPSRAPAADPAVPPPPAAETTAAPSSPTPARSPSSTTQNRSRPPSPASTTTAPNTREIRLLREAEVALARDPAAAQALLTTHRKEFPATILSQEREALEILADCAVSPNAEARRRRDAFGQRHPGSAYAARVRAACR
ncbi:MAG: hypothetical protein AAF799_20935 [Myxococcota bacterium]